MPNKKSNQGNWWKRVHQFLKTHTSITVIIVAALLLEVTTGVMYYASHRIVLLLTEQLISREMNAISLCIRNQLAKVEITLDNMSWVVTNDMTESDSLFRATYQLVEHNPSILGSSVSCIPNLYPERGYWFEPYSVRRADGTIESMQLGSASHDYTKSDFFKEPIARGSGYWSEPYLDSDGAKEIVTSYGVPVRNSQGKIVAVIDADLSLDWLDKIMNEGKWFKSTLRFLITGKYNMLAGKDSLLCNTLIEQIKAYGDYGYFTLEYQDKLKHVFYTPVGGKTDWVLTCVLDDNEVFGELRRVQLFLLLMAMAGFLLLGFIVWRTSRNLERLRKVNAEKERISSELRVASKIQQSMLPQSSLKQDDIEIYGSLVPAREVGGDLFDYFVRNEKLFFCIGDVSGKGTPSAMLMASTRSLFRAFSAHKNNPAQIMNDINESACQGNDTSMFVTLIIGVLDLPTGHLRYCNAGHDAPIIMANGQWTELDAQPHLPIGLFADVKYGVQEIYLQPNSTIFLYTDGLTEAMSMERKQFGLKNIQTNIASCTDKHPKEILDTISEAVHNFVGDAEQSDDLTMLVIHYTPQQFNNILNEALTLKNDVREVKKFSSFIKEVLEKLNIDKSLSTKLRLAVEEAVVNVIEYAYPAGSEGTVDICMMSDGHQLKVMITDAGVAFDPTAHEKIDITLSAEDRQIGGLGIHLVRELMDTINYERINGKNVLTLIKQINKE